MHIFSFQLYFTINLMFNNHLY